jgi:hypothetical protein
VSAVGAIAYAAFAVWRAIASDASFRFDLVLASLGAVTSVLLAAASAAPRAGRWTVAFAALTGVAVLAAVVVYRDGLPYSSPPRWDGWSTRRPVAGLLRLCADEPLEYRDRATSCELLQRRFAADQRRARAEIVDWLAKCPVDVRSAPVPCNRDQVELALRQLGPWPWLDDAAARSERRRWALATDAAASIADAVERGEAEDQAADGDLVGHRPRCRGSS